MYAYMHIRTYIHTYIHTAINEILTAFLKDKDIGISHPIREPPSLEKKEYSESREGMALESIDGGSME